MSKTYKPKQRNKQMFKPSTPKTNWKYGKVAARTLQVQFLGAYHRALADAYME